MRAVAFVALSVMLVTGCATSPNQQPPAAVETSAPAEVPEPAPVESERPAVLDRLDALEYQEFNTLHRDERLVWAWDRLDDEHNRSEHARLLAGQGKPEWTEVSVDNNGQQIANNFIYVIDNAALQHIPSEQKPNPYDSTSGNKLLSAAYYYVGDGVTSNDYKAKRDAVNTRTTPAKINANLTVTQTSELQSGLDQDGNPIQFKDLEFFTESGTSHKARFIFHEFTTATGERQALWLLEQQIAPDESFIERQ